MSRFALFLCFWSQGPPPLSHFMHPYHFHSSPNHWTNDDGLEENRRIKLTLNNMGVDCTGPLIHGLFSINISIKCYKFISLPYNIFFSLAYYFTVGIQSIIHIRHKISVNQLFMFIKYLLIGFWSTVGY